MLLSTLNSQQISSSLSLCRRLLEKYAQYQEQRAQLRAKEGRGETEEEDVEEILTPDEKSTAERVQKTNQK